MAVVLPVLCCGGGGRGGVHLLIQWRKAAKLDVRETPGKPPSAMLHALYPFAWQSPAEREPEWIACMNEPDLQAKRAPTEAGRPLPYPDNQALQPTAFFVGSLPRNSKG